MPLSLQSSTVLFYYLSHDCTDQLSHACLFRTYPACERVALDVASDELRHYRWCLCLHKQLNRYREQSGWRQILERCSPFLRTSDTFWLRSAIAAHIQCKAFGGPLHTLRRECRYRSLSFCDLARSISWGLRHSDLDCFTADYYGYLLLELCCIALGSQLLWKNRLKCTDIWASRYHHQAILNPSVIIHFCLLQTVIKHSQEVINS